MPTIPRPTKSRWRWHIRGQVQGVGFRPFVFRVATHAGVTGTVFNDAAGVHVEIQGTDEALAAFEAGFQRDMPPLARVASCQRSAIPAVSGERGFVIQPSPDPVHFTSAEAAVAIDTAVCPECLREMNDPANRRFRHALINCTNCGPRFSILRDVPYDRKNTTMADFALCADCKREYGDPADRRFHAQPICCRHCGPKVELVRVIGGGSGTGGSNLLDDERVRCRTKHVAGDPFERAAEMLLAGKIVAIKGLGGFHLAVRADDELAMARLRSLKQRDAKPFALMCRDVAMARALVELSPAGEAELKSPRAPIVLAPRRGGGPADKETRNQGEQRAAVAASVAPGTNLLGIMLPYTPIHHLLWHAMSHMPALRETASVPALVMTSGNLAQEPLVIDNQDALARLGPLCDAILWHDRPIERCVDDSVILDRGPQRDVLPIRRSRGYAPTVWTAAGDPPGSGLCVGGELKSTVAVVRRGEIVVSQHFGDLTDARSYANFRTAIDDLIRLFHVPVEFVVHDLHPNYLSTHAAREIAAQFNARLIPLQHHAAHAFGVMGEHQLDEALALICDGTGYGVDGSIWGGELLVVRGAHWKRIGRLKPMRLPGGDAAARDPRRSAMALLHNAFGRGFEELPEAAALFPQAGDRALLARMITGGVSSPWTSSTGRLFDGIAALLGICLKNDHEAQAPMALEAAAWSAIAAADHGRFTMPEESLFEVRRAEGDTGNGGGVEELWEIDFSPLVRWLVEQLRRNGPTNANLWARMFHQVLAEGWISLATAAEASAGGAARQHLPLVMSGGTFCNRLLEQDLAEVGAAKLYRTFFHKSYPPTDAGLAFGQAHYSQRLRLTQRA